MSAIYAVKTHHPFHVKARCEVPRRYPGVPGVPGVPSVYIRVNPQLMCEYPSQV